MKVGMKRFGHVHKSQVITNSNYCQQVVEKLVTLSPMSVKCLSHVTTANYDGRTYSQVMSGKSNSILSVSVNTDHMKHSGLLRIFVLVMQMQLVLNQSHMSFLAIHI